MLLTEEPTLILGGAHKFAELLNSLLVSAHGCHASLQSKSSVSLHRNWILISTIWIQFIYTTALCWSPLFLIIILKVGLRVVGLIGHVSPQVSQVCPTVPGFSWDRNRFGCWVDIFLLHTLQKEKKVPIRLSISVPRKTWDKPKTWDSGHATCHLPYLHIHTSHLPLSTLQPLRLFLSRNFSEIKR